MVLSWQQQEDALSNHRQLKTSSLNTYVWGRVYLFTPIVIIVILHPTNCPWQDNSGRCTGTFLSAAHWMMLLLLIFCFYPVSFFSSCLGTAGPRFAVQGYLSSRQLVKSRAKLPLSVPRAQESSCRCVSLAWKPWSQWSQGPQERLHKPEMSLGDGRCSK